MHDPFHVYVDFDRTLYDTPRFSTNLWQAIAHLTSVPAAQIAADSKRFHSDPVLGGYDYLAHTHTYGLRETDMWQLLERVTNADTYLYDDSVAFVHSLQADGYTPHILSFGEQRFQEAKIQPTLSAFANQGTAPGFTVVFRPKREHLTELHPGQHGVLVDDIPDQRLPLGFAEIHIDRMQPRTQPVPKPDGYTVSNLMQAYEVIQKLHPMPTDNA